VHDPYRVLLRLLDDLLIGFDEFVEPDETRAIGSAPSLNR